MRALFGLWCCVACGSRVIGSLNDGASGGAGGAFVGAASGSAPSAAFSGAAGAGGQNASGGGGLALGSSGSTPSASGGDGERSGGGEAAGAAPAGAAAGSSPEGGAAGEGPAPPEPKALMLVDARLFALLGDKLEQYRKLAQLRRGFGIELRVEQGLDDRSFLDDKALLVLARAANPALEGVLFVGNVALPTFYKPRYDNLQTRFYPYFYEDLDATWMRAQDPGTLDPLCVKGAAQAQQNCNVLGDNQVPPHDYDRLVPGASLGPELWSAYLPVGVSGGANDYAGFAAQLGPYLDKLIAFYTGLRNSNGRYYFLSNDPGWSKLELLWSATQPSRVDFYGKPGPQGQVGDDCITGAQNLCYVRWPLDSYPTFAAFKLAYEALPFLGEGWQQPSIYAAHMNASLYEMVEVDVPSDYGWSVLGTEDTAALSKTGLIVALSGSNVTGFAQPRLGCTVDIQSALPSSSVGVAYLYGKSQALAVLGDPTQRGHYGNFPVVYEALKAGAAAYLGAAHRARMLQNYKDAGYEQCVADGGTNCGYTLSENGSEMLLGDPFLDLK